MGWRPNHAGDRSFLAPASVSRGSRQQPLTQTDDGGRSRRRPLCGDQNAFWRQLGLMRLVARDPTPGSIRSANHILVPVNDGTGHYAAAG